MAGDADGVIINQKVRSKKGGSDEKAGQTKKRKASTVVIHQNNNEQGTNDSSTKRRKSDAGTHQEEDLDTSRPTAIFKPKSARSWTVSIALPGSWLNNARKPDHKTLQVGRIARAAAVFSVDEIVIYDDDPGTVDPKVVNDRYIRQGRKANKSKQEILESILEEDEPWQNPDQFLYHVLSFAECPPHLRMRLFPKHKNLEQAGLLPSMDMPHHLKAHEWCQFREGVIVGPAGNNKHGAQVYIDCGLPYPVRVAAPPEAPLEAGMRTTVRFADVEPPASWPHLSQVGCDALEASACAPSLPREEGGYYWGYTVRRTASLSAVFSECEYPGGYDYTIGTSERGVDVRSILPGYTAASGSGVAGPFNHLLLVFGGVAGIEPAVANDPVLAEKGLGKTTAHTLFDAWVNLVPGQGSRTIRTEEAVEFGLCALKPYVDSMYEK